MGAILALFVIVGMSLLVVRVGATALMMTGLSWDTASFQAYSAFFGVGFTTSEAEMVVSHPVRRRIIRDLIIGGNIGITSALATLIVTFVQPQGAGRVMITVVCIVAGLVGLAVFAKLGFIARPIDWVIRKTLERAGVVHAMDYELLLRVAAGYCVSEIEVLEDSACAGRTLAQWRPIQQGVLILSITHPDGSFVGAPKSDEIISPGDMLTVYGREHDIRAIASRVEPSPQPA